MESYEQKYKEALERAKKMYVLPTDKWLLESIFPELAESEDERIRKALICGLSEGLSEHNWQGFGGATIDECIAYLEKQKEQKPVEWSEDNERIRLACIATINDVIDYERDRWEDYNPGKPYRPITKYDEQIDWLKSLRPQPHWKPSEVQMGSLRLAIDSAKKAQMYATADTLNEIYEQLKKL